MRTFRKILSYLKRPAFIKNKITKGILVVGHPRSATGYAAKLLEAYGLEIGHEVMKKNGISSWMYTVPTIQSIPHGENTLPRFYNFENVIHIVRDPIKVVTSMAYSVLPDPITENFIALYVPMYRVPDHRICKAVYSCVMWNRLARLYWPNSTIMKAENIEHSIESYLKERNLLHTTVHRQNLLPEKDYNTRKRSIQSIELEEIAKNCPQWLFEDFKKHCFEYGYTYKQLE